MMDRSSSLSDEQHAEQRTAQPLSPHSFHSCALLHVGHRLTADLIRRLIYPLCVLPALMARPKLQSCNKSVIVIGFPLRHAAVSVRQPWLAMGASSCNLHTTQAVQGGFEPFSTLDSGAAGWPTSSTDLVLDIPLTLSCNAEDFNGRETTEDTQGTSELGPSKLSQFDHCL